METIKNLTGRDIIVWWLEFPSDGNIKLSQSITKLWEYQGIDIIKSTFWEALLPDETDDTGYIVSHIVCQKFPDRKDLYIVWGKMKNETWLIVWAQHLIFNPYYNEQES